MTELEDRLRAHPDDLGTWRVYGDWLLERGDVRGALIQLHHRLESTRDPAVVQKEIDQLVDNHRTTWRAELPELVEPVEWRFGFVTKIATTWDDGAGSRVAEALRAMPFAAALKLTTPATENPEDDIDDDGEPVLPPTIEIAALAALDLGGLRELDLAYLRIGAAGGATLAKLRLDALRALDLRYAALEDEGVAALAASTHLGNLERLQLQSNGITATGVSALAKAAFARLVELDLRYNAIGAEGAEALMTAPFADRLRRLALYRSDVSDAGIATLARSTKLAPQLRSYWRGL